MLYLFAEQVVGSESIDETNVGNQVSKFLDGYREGSVVTKHLSGPTLAGFIKSQSGVRIVLMLIFVVLVLILIYTMSYEEPLTVGTRDQAADGRSSTSHQETREQHQDTLKED